MTRAGLTIISERAGGITAHNDEKETERKRRKG